VNYQLTQEAILRSITRMSYVTRIFAPLKRLAESHPARNTLNSYALVLLLFSGYVLAGSIILSAVWWSWGPSFASGAYWPHNSEGSQPAPKPIQGQGRGQSEPESDG